LQEISQLQRLRNLLASSQTLYKDPAMITPMPTALATFDPARLQAISLAQTLYSKVMLVCLEPGQAIPVHSPQVETTMTILQGRAALVAGEDVLKDAGPGALMHAPRGQARGIRAVERTIALVVVTPPPTPEDHREVAAHLEKGTFR
jgi:quercetin dioxygenase-like cupin family protein